MAAGSYTIHRGYLMKKTRRRISNHAPPGRVLQLSRETLRTLSSAGQSLWVTTICDTTSVTTEHTDSESAVQCAATVTCR
jgi:hypothetical protein